MSGAVDRGRRPARAAQALTLAVGSGKGGVGKTSLCANLAVALARTGLSVTVLDGDLGLANLDVLLGLAPKRTIEHFFRDGAPLEELALEGPLGVRVVPAGSGLPELTRFSPDDLIRLSVALGGLRRTSDILLIDTPAGIGDGAAGLWLLADRFLLVTWPEPTALVDAYAALKVVVHQSPARDVGLIVNGVEDADEATRVHCRLDAAAQRFLNRHVAFDGYVVRDEAVTDAARRQRAAVLIHPLSPASRCFERLALHLAALSGRGLRGATGQTWASNSSRPGEILH